MFLFGVAGFFCDVVETVTNLGVLRIVGTPISWFVIEGGNRNGCDLGDVPGLVVGTGPRVTRPILGGDRIFELAVPGAARGCGLAPLAIVTG
jgi:hypothetical protein